MKLCGKLARCRFEKLKNSLFILELMVFFLFVCWLPINLMTQRRCWFKSSISPFVYVNDLLENRVNILQERDRECEQENVSFSWTWLWHQFYICILLDVHLIQSQQESMKTFHFEWNNEKDTSEYVLYLICICILVLTTMQSGSM